MPWEGVVIAYDTWHSLVRRALVEIGARAAVETPTPDEYADGIKDLQIMLDEWALEGLLVPGLTHYTHTIGSPAKSVFTISADASLNPDIAGEPPLDIEVLAYKQEGDTDYRPVVQTSYIVYSETLRREVTSPSLYYYEHEHPVARIYFNTNTTPGDSFMVSGQTYLTSAAIVGTDAPNLPRGYDRGVMLNLAVFMAASYGVKGGLSRETSNAAMKSKMNITKRNIGSTAFRLDRSLTAPSRSGIGMRGLWSGY